MNAPLARAAMPLTLGRVVDVADPEGLYRIKVSLYSFAEASGQEGTVWAGVAMPVAGNAYGTLFVPDVGDDVVVGFLNGDTRAPIVLGAFHSSANPPAEEAVDGSAIKRWSITGRGGTRIAIDETSEGPKVTVETPGGCVVTLKDQGQEIKATNGSSTVTIGPSGVRIEASGNVDVQAAQVNVSAGMVKVDAGISTFSGVVKCDALIATTVIGTTYTPGAGNIW